MSDAFSMIKFYLASSSDDNLVSILSQSISDVSQLLFDYFSEHS
ncbi:hypothetical protein HMPREF9999_00240 [Alloprevotella sp. oral taxon 473 str. F0040]|nr:hypothetical protein HMPREF9999_00240 [Alloprevotella sp. oral taxon 473 str. F0040]